MSPSTPFADSYAILMSTVETSKSWAPIGPNFQFPSKREIGPIYTVSPMTSYLRIGAGLLPPPVFGTRIMGPRQTKSILKDKAHSYAFQIRVTPHGSTKR